VEKWKENKVSIAMSWYHASVSGFSLRLDVCHLLDAHNRMLAKARAKVPRLGINLSNKKDKSAHSVMWNAL
jgi:hypothetical protein